MLISKPRTCYCSVWECLLINKTNSVHTTQCLITRLDMPHTIRHETHFHLHNNCNLDFQNVIIGYWSHSMGFSRYCDGCLCRLNASVLLSRRKTNPHSHMPPVPANCKCWGAECWCMHILSNTAVKLPVKRPEEHCSQALTTSLPDQNELTLTQPLIKKVIWGEFSVISQILEVHSPY